MYEISPQWTISQEGPVLYVSGGADAMYAVELSNSEPSEYAISARKIDKNKLRKSDEEIFEQLFTAGIIRVLGNKKPALSVAIVGDSVPFGFSWSDSIKTVKRSSSADIVLVVRYSSTQGAIAHKYYRTNKPYIYVDVAYHHTISIGPLVYAGETACIGCLFGRIMNRWGDAKPPKEPALSEHWRLINTLIESELIKYRNGDTSLVGTVVAWDVIARSVVADKLLKSSACPQCGDTSSIDQTMVL